jgi:hypothetical protein
VWVYCTYIRTSLRCVVPNVAEKAHYSIQVSGGMEEWRRLKLKVLRQRIQRLVVLMDLSEPGTVPDPGMLASLIDLVCSIY